MGERHSGHKPGRESGFTLVELLVVLVILGLLAAIAVPQVMGYLDRARSDAAALQIRRFDALLDLYRLDVGRYPSAEEGLVGLVENPGVERWRGPYLKDAEGLLDPWGNAYEYRIESERGPYQVISYGADGAPGGEGADADIVRASG